MTLSVPSPDKRRGWCQEGHPAINIIICNCIGPTLESMPPTPIRYLVEQEEEDENQAITLYNYKYLP